MALVLFTAHATNVQPQVCALDSLEGWESADTQPTSSMALGDFNGDGWLDIVVGTCGGNNDLIYFSDNGSLQRVARWRCEPDETRDGGRTYTRCVSPVDLENDGDADLLTSGGGLKLYLNSDNVLANRPSLRFGAQEGSSWWSIVSSWGDFDNDGDLDLFQSSSDWYLPARLYENQSGDLDTVAIWTLRDSASATSAEFVDIDHDGDLDLCVGYSDFRGGTQYALDFIRIYENENGAIGHIPWQIIPYANRGLLLDCAWGDVNADGYIDLVVSFYNGVLIYRNRSGTLDTIPEFVLDFNTTKAPIRLADVDSDGYLDLLAGGDELGLGFVSCYRNLGGVFDPLPCWQSPKGEGPIQGLAIGDLDGDGDLDVAVSSYGVRVYYNRTMERDQWIASWHTEDDIGFGAVASGDIDGDGLVDLVLGGWPTRTFQNVEGRFQTDPTWYASERSWWYDLGVALQDFDGDGDNDLIVASGWDTTRYYNNTAGQLATRSTWPNTERGDFRPTCVASGDVDGDGDIDLVLGDDTEGARLYRNGNGALDSAYSWKPSGFYGEYSSDCLALGDIDGDGDLDLAMGGENQPIRIFENASGTFSNTAVWRSLERRYTGGISFGDVDGDGDLDLAVGNWNAGGRNELYMNVGVTLESQPGWSSLDETATSDVAMVDIDGDGDLDFVVAERLGLVRAYLNSNGSIARQFVPIISDSGSISGMDWADYDQDGDLDLLCAGKSTYPPQKPGEAAIYDNPRNGRPGTTTQNNSRLYVQEFKIIPRSAGTTEVVAQCKLTDAESDPAHIVSAEYRRQFESSWYPATLRERYQALKTSPGGVTQSIVWDASGDPVTGRDIVFRLRFASNNQRVSFEQWSAVTCEASIGAIDNAPALTLLYPHDGSVLDDSIPVLGSASDILNFESIDVSLRDVRDTSGWLVLQRSQSPHPSIGLIATLPAVEIPNGEYALRVRASDRAGHVRSLERAISIRHTGVDAPQVVASWPWPSLSNVPTKSPIVMQFSTPMNPASIDATTLVITSSDGNLDVTPRYDIVTRTLILTPAPPLTAGRFYYAVLGPGFASVRGFPIAAEVSTWFASSRQDCPNDVRMISPSYGETGVPLQQPIRFSRGESFNFQNVTIADLDGNGVWIDSVRQDPSGRILDVFHRPLAPRTFHLMRISDQEGGEGAADFLGYFMTGDFVQPTIDSVAPSPRRFPLSLQQPITVYFSKEMNVFSIDSTSFYVVGPHGRVSGQILVDNVASKTVAEYSPHGPYEPDSRYRLVLTGRIQDYAGRAIDSFEWEFLTGLSARIPPTGGLLSADSISIYFPPGCFSAETDVRVGRVIDYAASIPENSDSAYLRIYDISADQTVREPIILSVTLPALTFDSPAVPTIYLWSDSSWRYLGGTYGGPSMPKVEAVLSKLGRLGIFLSSSSPSSPPERLSNLTLTPRAFSPAGGTFRGELSVGFTLAEPGPATIKVYNLAGRLVRILADNQWMSSGSNVVTWSGQDYEGSVVPSGLYIVTVEAAGRTAKNTVAVVNQ